MRLAFLHGFTQTHHSWHECADLIARGFAEPPTLVLPDLPGHGLSTDDRSDIAQASIELATLVGPSTLVGYSMGGRFALHTALVPGNQIERLVLVGATPGLAGEHERASRRAQDEERAAHLEQVGVDAFLDEWLSAPLFETLPLERSGLEHRRDNTVAGLAHSLRTAGTGTQQPLWDRLGDIEVPVLVLAGELDTKFTAIGRDMAAALSNARFEPIPGAGHAAHTEQPGAVATAIITWLTDPVR